MEGHERNLYLYDRFNARVAGVSRDDLTILKHWTQELELTFPLLSNVSSYLGLALGTQPHGAPVFARRTVIIDKWGVIRYVQDGSPDFRGILLELKKLHQEEEAKP